MVSTVGPPEQVRAVYSEGAQSLARVAPGEIGLYTQSENSLRTNESGL